MDNLALLCAGLVLSVRLVQIRADGYQYCPDVQNKNETTFVIGEVCYHLRQEPDVSAIWSDAQSDCVSRGGHLFVVNSQTEQDAIFRELDIISTIKSPWMGVRKQDGAWTSVRGSLKYTNWESNPGPGDCAYFDLERLGVWGRRPCSEYKWFLGYVCQHDQYSHLGAGTTGLHGRVSLGCLSVAISVALGSIWS